MTLSDIQYTEYNIIHVQHLQYQAVDNWFHMIFFKTIFEEKKNETVRRFIPHVSNRWGWITETETAF